MQNKNEKKPNSKVNAEKLFEANKSSINDERSSIINASEEKKKENKKDLKNNKNFIDTIFRKTLTNSNSNLIFKQNLKIDLSKNKDQLQSNMFDNDNKFKVNPSEKLNEIKSHREKEIKTYKIKNMNIEFNAYDTNTRKLSNSFLVDNSRKHSNQKSDEKNSTKRNKESADKQNSKNEALAFKNKTNNSKHKKNIFNEEINKNERSENKANFINNNINTYNSLSKTFRENHKLENNINSIDFSKTSMNFKFMNIDKNKTNIYTSQNKTKNNISIIYAANKVQMSNSQQISNKDFSIYKNKTDDIEQDKELNNIQPISVTNANTKFKSNQKLRIFSNNLNQKSGIINNIVTNKKNECNIEDNILIEKNKNYFYQNKIAADLQQVSSENQDLNIGKKFNTTFNKIELPMNSLKIISDAKEKEKDEDKNLIHEYYNLADGANSNKIHEEVICPKDLRNSSEKYNFNSPRKIGKLQLELLNKRMKDKITNHNNIQNDQENKLSSNCNFNLEKGEKIQKMSYSSTKENFFNKKFIIEDINNNLPTKPLEANPATINEDINLNTQKKKLKNKKVLNLTNYNNSFKKTNNTKKYFIELNKSSRNNSLEKGKDINNHKNNINKDGNNNSHKNTNYNETNISLQGIVSANNRINSSEKLKTVIYKENANQINDLNKIKDEEPEIPEHKNNRNVIFDNYRNLTSGMNPNLKKTILAKNKNYISTSTTGNHSNNIYNSINLNNDTKDPNIHETESKQSNLFASNTNGLIETNTSKDANINIYLKNNNPKGNYKSKFLIKDNISNSYRDLNNKLTCNINKAEESRLNQIDSKKLKLLIINKENKNSSESKKNRSIKISEENEQANKQQDLLLKNKFPKTFSLDEKNDKTKNINYLIENKDVYNNHHYTESKNSRFHSILGNIGIDKDIGERDIVDNANSYINNTYSTLARKLKQNRELQSKNIMEVFSNSNFEILGSKKAENNLIGMVINNYNKNGTSTNMINNSLNNKTISNRNISCDSSNKSSNIQNHLAMSVNIPKSGEFEIINEKFNLLIDNNNNNNYIKSNSNSNYFVENNNNSNNFDFSKNNKYNHNNISNEIYLSDNFSSAIKDNINKKHQFSKSNPFLNVNENLNNFNTKTTKDTLKFSYSQNKNLSQLEIDGPEELHYLYINLCQQNKRLVYKFDKVDENNKSEKFNSETVFLFGNQVEI